MKAERKQRSSTKPRGAERRQVTALSYDLVGSTRLAVRLDPEDVRALQRVFHETCTAAVTRYEGHVGRYTGDGAMAFFGYPEAHEDDPERAVRAGLAIVRDCLSLNDRKLFSGAEISVRVGIATGLVVAGTSARDRAFDQDDVVGIAPNLAFKIQASCAPNSIVVSNITRELTSGLFQCRALAPLVVPGFDRPQAVWQVLRSRARQKRSWRARVQSVTPLVSREDDLANLIRCWERVERGEGQLVSLSGEPGIGKTRIVSALRESIPSRHHYVITLQCSSQETDTAFHPIIHLLDHLIGVGRSSNTAIAHRLGTLLERPEADFEEIAPYLARLMQNAGGLLAHSADLTLEQIKQNTMNLIAELLEEMSRQRPLLLICEDIHWIDPTTEELLKLVAARLPRLRALLLATFRPTYDARWTDLHHVMPIALDRLNEQQAAAMVSYLARDLAVPQAVVDRIVALADGVPLFIEELSRTVFAADGSTALTSDGSSRGPGGSSGMLSNDSSIPATLSDSLTARLDQLEAGREIAQVCSVIGRSFTTELVSKVAGVDEGSLNAALDDLVRTELMTVRGRGPQAVYTFRHALIQESAYRSILRTARQQIHLRVAEVLVSDYADTSDGAPEIIARHFEESGAPGEAIPHLHRAAQIAVARSANVEAVRLLERAIHLLTMLPDGSERDSLELSLLVSLGPPRLSLAGSGAPAVQNVYERAVALCDQLPSGKNHFAAHWGWWFTSRDNREALHRVNRLSSLTALLDDSELALQAHHCQWSTQFCLGDHVRASEHIAHGLRIYDNGDYRHHSALYGGHDPKCCALGLGSLSLFLTGAYERSLDWIERAVAHAKTLQQSGSIRHSRDQEIMLYRFRGDAAAVLTRAEEMAAYATDEGFKGLAVQAKVFMGWARAIGGDVQAGVELIKDGLIEHMAINTHDDLPIYYEMAAEAYSAKGEPESGLPLLDEAIAVAEQTSLQTWLAELFRRKGILLLQQSKDNGEAARACFAKAIIIAEQQHARALLLRALCEQVKATSGQERFATCTRVATLCDALSEGQLYSDVVEARRLLDICL